MSKAFLPGTNQRDACMHRVGTKVAHAGLTRVRAPESGPHGIAFDAVAPSPTPRRLAWPFD